ncbi:MAG: histidinol-phosphate aminotransferase family protein [Myxococcales bacterium]|nr:histidinol-phosphate aminotransferase family protein [Myxococcales bacterium]
MSDLARIHTLPSDDSDRAAARLVLGDVLELHSRGRPFTGATITRRLVDAAARLRGYAMPACEPDGVARLHLNENLLADERPELARYPEGGDRRLLAALARRHGVPEEAVFVNLGASGIIHQLLGAFTNAGATALLPAPTWSFYHSVLAACRIRWREVELRVDDDAYAYDVGAWIAAIERDMPSLVALISPNNPTGNRIAGADVLALARTSPDTLIVVDEAYHGLADDDPLGAAELLAAADNVVLIRTFSKALGLAGIRVGYALSGRMGAALLRRTPVPFGLPAAAQEVALARLGDPERLAEIRERCRAGRDAFANELSGRTGFTVYRSDANFVLTRVPEGRGLALRDHLLGHGVQVKLMGGRLRDHLRITVAEPALMRRIAGLLVDAA